MPGSCAVSGVVSDSEVLLIPGRVMGTSRKNPNRRGMPSHPAHRQKGLTTVQRSGPFVQGDRVQLTDAKGRKYTVVLQPGSEFFTHAGAVRHEDVAHAPHGLDVARAGGVLLDQLAQARDLHVQAAVADAVVIAVRQRQQLLAAQRPVGLAGQRAQQLELDGADDFLRRDRWLG